jgi:hypothetical protein
MSKDNVKSLGIAMLLLIGVIGSFCYASYKHQQYLSRKGVEYQFIVTDDSATIYDGPRTIGTIKLTGELSNLINEDNE